MMSIKELEEKIKEIRKNNPDLDVDELEIAPLFDNGVLMMVSNVYLVEEGAWTTDKINGEKAIAVEWHC